MYKIFRRQYQLQNSSFSFLKKFCVTVTKVPHLADSDPLAAWPKWVLALSLRHAQLVKSDHFSALGNHSPFHNWPSYNKSSFSKLTSSGKVHGTERGGELGSIFRAKVHGLLHKVRHFAGVYRMLGLISRQAPRLLRQPGSLIFRRSLADGSPAVSLTFGSPSEVCFV